MPWKAPTGSGGIHVARNRFGEKSVKGMAPADPPDYAPSEAEIAEDEFDAFARLMSAAPGGVTDGRTWVDRSDAEVFE